MSLKSLLISKAIWFLLIHFLLIGPVLLFLKVCIQCLLFYYYDSIIVYNARCFHVHIVQQLQEAA